MLIYMHIIASNSTREVKNGNMDHHLTVWHDAAGWGQFRAEYNDRRQTARRVCGDATGNCVAADTAMLSNYRGISGILAEPYLRM
jgi:hypothetical protein